MFTWDALKDNAKHAKILLKITEFCLNPFLREQKKSDFVLGKPDANVSSWSYDMEGHAKKCVERYCELANIPLPPLLLSPLPSNCTKSQLHALTTIISKQKNWDLLENCQKYAHKLC